MKIGYKNGDWTVRKDGEEVHEKIESVRVEADSDNPEPHVVISAIGTEHLNIEPEESDIQFNIVEPKYEKFETALKQIKSRAEDMGADEIIEAVDSILYLIKEKTRNG